MNNFTSATWWANEQRKRHERRAEQFEREAEHTDNPQRAQRLKQDAQYERNRARQWDMGVRF